MRFFNVFRAINEKANVDTITFKRSFLNDVLLLEFESNFFEARLNGNLSVQNKINEGVKEQVDEFYEYSMNVLFPQAKNDYMESLNSGYTFNPYSAYSQYTITYNKNCFFSYYYDNYTFTGGAHGNTIRHSKTTSLNSGDTISLSDFFRKEENYKEIVLTEILRQAEKNMSADPNLYFENYKELIVKNFNKKSFYLSDDGIVIYFGQYDIAPYAVGIVEFTIPYSMVAFPPTC